MCFKVPFHPNHSMTPRRRAGVFASLVPIQSGARKESQEVLPCMAAQAVCARGDLGKGGFSHCPWTGNMLLWE